MMSGQLDYKKGPWILECREGDSYYFEIRMGDGYRLVRCIIPVRQFWGKKDPRDKGKIPLDS